MPPLKRCAEIMSLAYEPAREPFAPIVIAACKSVAPDSTPLMVHYKRTRRHSQSNQCHDNVKRTVRKFGGSVQLGWSIRVMEGVAVWLELHSVWRHPDRHLLCVTEPPSERVRRLSFLPCSSTDTTGPELPSFYHPWEDTPGCHEFVELSYAFDRLYFPDGDP